MLWYLHRLSHMLLTMLTGGDDDFNRMIMYHVYLYVKVAFVQFHSLSDFSFYKFISRRLAWHTLHFGICIHPYDLQTQRMLLALVALGWFFSFWQNLIMLNLIGPKYWLSAVTLSKKCLHEMVRLVILTPIRGSGFNACMLVLDGHILDLFLVHW